MTENLLTNRMESCHIEAPDNSVYIITETFSEPESVELHEQKSRSLRRKRSNSEDSLLHLTKNKTIKKKRGNASAVELKTEKEVKMFYLNINKNIKFKPILLETIFEADEENDDEREAVSRDLGKALKRTIKICDGLNINKSLVNKRKNLIKKKFGNRKKPKKVALKKFMEDFKKKTEEEKKKEELSD